MPIPADAPTMPGASGGTLYRGGATRRREGDLDTLVAARVAGLSIQKAAQSAGYAVRTAQEVLRRRDVVDRIEQGKRELREDLLARINAASVDVIRVHLEAMKAVDDKGYPTTIALRAAENLLNRLAPATTQIAVEARGQAREAPEERNRRLDALLANIEARLALPNGERERQTVELVAEHDVADAEVVE